MKPPSCQGCSLAYAGRGFVRGDGPGTNGILLVGEALGADEARIGRPFVGAAGFFLDRILKRAGLPREDFRVANTVCCQPPGNNLHAFPGAIAHCAPNLDAEIDALKPKVIVALGGVALQRLTGFSSINRGRGYILDGPRGIPVIGTFHPAFLMPRKDRPEGQDKNPWRLIGLTILDLKKAARIAEGGFRREDPRYLCDPPPCALDQFYLEYERAGFPPLSYDIETPGKLVATDESELEELERSSVVIRIGFCFAPGYAISVPWDGPYLATIRRLLQSPGEKVGWNSYGFDDDILAREGAPVLGTRHDAMWAWHLLQSDLPRGLESVGGVYADGLRPWKHLGESEPAYYNAQDTDVALRNFLGIQSDLRSLGLWDFYLDHIVRLQPVLAAATSNGVHVDTVAQDALRAKLTAESQRLLSEAQALAPREVRARKRYKQRPGDDVGREFDPVIVPAERKFCSHCGQLVSNKSEHLKGGKKKNPCAAAQATLLKRITDVTEWDEVLPFNPLGDDLERYIKHFNHPMGVNAKNGRETLDSKHLDTLIKKYGAKHRIYPLTREIRKVSKILGTFLYDAPDGRIHAEYTFSPSSGRLSSRNPNLQNVTHGSSNPYADDVRRTIIPPPGMVFVEADSAAIEAVMSGYFMGDPTYMELATIGVHDYVTCLELGLEFDPTKLAAYKKDPAYALARERNKRVVHGSNYGMTPRLMAKLFPEQFPSVAKATEAQDRYFAACPALPDWHHRLRVTAHRQCYLQNPWGRRHYFWHVFGKNAKTGKISLGEDAKRAVSFLPQSSAADFQQENALLLAEQLPSHWIIPANFLVHDSYCLAVPEADVDEAVNRLCHILTRPIGRMGGLQVGCEVKVGTNWADMKSVRTVRPEQDFGRILGVAA